MARRSSARLRGKDSSTPKRVSLSHDALIKTPRTAPVKLSSLPESDEVPGAFPQSASPPSGRSKRIQAEGNITTTGSAEMTDSTPKHATILPASEEMHPQQYHQSTAKPLDEARWLGFASMGAHTEPPKRDNRIAAWQATPTRAPRHGGDLSSPKFNLDLSRERSLELSPEGKEIMNEKREEAVKIREQMIANGEGVESVSNLVGRKIATPKGPKSRFSDVHLDQFKKMDSIAGHASAFRADPGRVKPSTPGLVPQNARRIEQTASKSLKRSPSKAQLDEPEPTSTRHPPPSATKHIAVRTESQLPRTDSGKSIACEAEPESPSPKKRVKRTGEDGQSIAYPSLGEYGLIQPTTPRSAKAMKPTESTPLTKSLASPTQAFLARMSTIKSSKPSKIPGLGLSLSPSKPQSTVTEDKTIDSPKSSTPLLSRSPSKPGAATKFSNDDAKADKIGSPKHRSPLLTRAPIKASPCTKKVENAMSGEIRAETQPALLSRSPLKVSIAKTTISEPLEDKSKDNKAPLLSKTPMKISVSTIKESVISEGEKKGTSAVPLLARSPTKIAAPSMHRQPESASPSQSSGSLKDCVGSVHPSPVKSILRTPQRLYSDDPTKIAAGTHLATPPPYGGAHRNNYQLTTLPATAPAQKHVDFSSSTKARYDRAQSETSSDSPSRGSASPSNFKDEMNPASRVAIAEYPTLPVEESTQTLTPQKRRLTATPTDFTFRAGSHEIIFSNSPSAPNSTSASSRTPTIRHVSGEPRPNIVNPREDLRSTPVAARAQPPTTSKKRKFDFENSQASQDVVRGSTSESEDKENATPSKEDERPSKRVKQSVSTAVGHGAAFAEPKTKSSATATKKAATRVPTLGVKPKGAKSKVPAAGNSAAKDTKNKKTNVISQSRLNALAQPKKRG